MKTLKEIREARMDDIKKHYDVKNVPLHKITPVRSPEDDNAKVTHYREKLKNREHIDPIQVMKSNNTIVDGHHRFHAHKLEGRKTIPVAFPKK